MRLHRLTPLACIALAAAAPTVARAAGEPAGGATPDVPLEPLVLPASGSLALRRVAVRARPRATARIVRRMRDLRPDGDLTVVFADRMVEDRHGVEWVRIHLPGRPNGNRGWIRRDQAVLEHQPYEIVVDRSARRMVVRRDGRIVLRSRVAVGAPGTETPLGAFYLTASFRPTDAFLGPWAFETSAYSRLTEWPGGGVVGLHGTSAPESIGHFASHGCVRMPNRVALRLKRIDPVGASFRIVR